MAAASPVQAAAATVSPVPACPASPDTITAEPSASPLPLADPAEPSAQDVIAWYDAHARDLPWRRPGTTPWEVLVSEVMSQQTPVARVVPAWQEWMRRWPGPAELSQAPTAEVLRVWGRLGYPRRALRLIECARSVVEQHDGVLPDDLDALLALPGVGEYTAGADLAVLDLRTGLAVLALLGGDAVPAGLVGLELPAVGTVDRWLAHEHCPQGVFGCTGMCRGLVRLPTRPRGSPRQNSPSP